MKAWHRGRNVSRIVDSVVGSRPFTLPRASIAATWHQRSRVSASPLCSKTRIASIMSHFSTAVEVAAAEPVIPAVPSLNTWKQCLSKIPLSTFLPIGMGNASDLANRYAFFGDKVLNHRISQILREKQMQQIEESKESSTNSDFDNASEVYSLPDIGFLSLVQSQAMSNQLFAQNFSHILGSHPEMTAEVLELATAQTHDAGTMIEAAVDAILNHSTDIPKVEADVAIQELADYLVHMAYEATIYFNAKGQLLEMGGGVMSYRLDDTPDHCPKFRAIATFQNTTYRSDPPSLSKKMAEQIAATHILRLYRKLRKAPKIKQRVLYESTHPLDEDDRQLEDEDEEDDDEAEENAQRLSDDSIRVDNYDEDLVEDGVLPDDFYSDIQNVAKVRAALEEDDDDRPYDAKRFVLPKLHKKNQTDFYHISTTHTVNLKNGESPSESWRRGAYDKKSAYHRAVLAPSMLSDYVETVNGWTRMARKDLFTVLVVLIPKEKLSFKENKIYPTVKCFIRHDLSRNKARNALGLVVNQYIDQVILKNTDQPDKRRPVQTEKKLWPPMTPEEKMESYKDKFSRDKEPRPLPNRKLWKPLSEENA